MRPGRRCRRHQPSSAQHPRSGEAQLLLNALTRRLPSVPPPLQLRMVHGPPGDTHLHQRPGRPPEVRITDQLLDRAPAHVVSGVLAHELAHLLNDDRHRRRGYGLALTAAVSTLLAVAVALPSARDWLSPLTCALGFGLLAASRRLELQADSTSLRLVDVDQAVTALTWLQHDAQIADSPTATRWSPLRRLAQCELLSTHPNPAHRLRALRRASSGG